MLKLVAQWALFVSVTLGSMSAALGWVLHKDPPKAAIAPAPEPPPKPEPEPPAPVSVEVPEPERFEVALFRCLEGEPAVDQSALRRLADRSLIDVLVELVKRLEPDRDPETIHRSLFALGALARMGFPMKTPLRVAELARSGDLLALDAAARIGDPRAIDLFVELLRRRAKTEGECDLRGRAAHFARHTNSARVAAELNPMARGGSLTAVESLAFIGRGADRNVLINLSHASRNPMIRRWAVRALEAEEILSAPDADRRLMEAVERTTSSGPLFSWPEWALDKIASLRRTPLIEPLRNLSDAPTSVRLEILRTIRKLGGTLSEADLEAFSPAPLGD